MLFIDQKLNFPDRYTFYHLLVDWSWIACLILDRAVEIYTVEVVILYLRGNFTLITQPHNKDINL